MESRKIKFTVLLGLIAICGIVIIQLYWLKEAFKHEDKKFNQTVHIALLEVMKKLYGNQPEKMPQINPIQQVSGDYYVININDHVNTEVLEFYLKNEFDKFNLQTDFEFAVYNCENDEMVYGNYIAYHPVNSAIEKSAFFPKFDNLVYYFAIRFPSKMNFLAQSMKLWIGLTVILMAVLVIYVYSIFVILQQKRYSELQKDFINNMTHEFKTPLSSIMIASQYMMHQNMIQVEPRLHKYSETIFSQSKRLNTHVEKILNLASSEKKSLELEKSKINVVEIIKEVVENCKVNKHNSVQFDLHFETSQAYVLADEMHFSNILHNIIDNSIKYHDGLPKISILLKEETGRYILVMSDDGKGIDKKHQKKIFDKFYRVPEPDTKNTNGFGLGLFYVKKICKLHRWKVKLESTIQQGTKITLVMPKSS